MQKYQPQTISSKRRAKVAKANRVESPDAGATPARSLIGSFPRFALATAAMLLISAAELFLYAAGAKWAGELDQGAGLLGDGGLVLFPFFAVPLVVSMLYGARSAAFAGFFSAVAVWCVTGFDPCAFISAATGTLIASLAGPKVRRVADFAISAIRVFSTQAVLCVLAVLIPRLCGETDGNFAVIPQFAALFIFEMLAVPVAIWVLLPIAERLSRRTSSYTLSGFANLENPLLQRLSREAPGTYGHSMNVADIASAAAETVGADPLLARIGGYYHDVGKLSNPRYFMENQSALGNPHDLLPPTISAMIIASHVKDGAILAREAGLPKPIIRIIETHHGKSEMKWFSLKAEEKGRGDLVRDGIFRYGGSFPETREETIVSLADAVEAASRSLAAPDGASVTRLVSGIFAERIADGQLVASGMSVRDLEAVKQTMILTLLHRLHVRQAYPDQR